MSTLYALPENVELRNFAGDLVVVGVNLDAERFNEIKAGLPSEMQDQLIGWKRVIAL
jgi:hypothetical protein